MRRIVILGLGYAGRAVARRLAGPGFAVAGTARTAEGAAAIAGEGWQGLVFDGEQPGDGVAEALGAATHLLVAVPPEATGEPVLRHHALDIAGARDLAWIGYLSTVGVYGDHGGAWVDETTPCAPVSARGARRLEAEAAWQALGAAAGKRVAVFRLPGIYGPGRSAFDALRQGTARRVVKPGQVFNRIHVADIAGAVAAAVAAPDAAGVYNVTDDAPAPPEDVVAHAARLMGIEPPPEVPIAEAALSPMALSFYAESKRVSNRRLKQELGYRLRYPSYREGLAAIAAGQA
jgi:nucleoside-diphosphate-sugar epimerase